jgi:hypothetical protein
MTSRVGRPSIYLVREEAPDAHVVTQQRVWYMLGALELALGDLVPHERPVGFGAPGRTSTGPGGGVAQSSVAPLFRVVKKAAARFAGLGPFGLSLSARPPLR